MITGHRSSVGRAKNSARLYWLKYYWFRGGFLDGWPGYLYHRLHADYVFMKHALLWELHMRAPLAQPQRGTRIATPSR